MKVEILARGKIENVLKDMNIQYKVTYSGDKYKVIELEKMDAKNIGNSFLTDAWCCFSNGARGSLCDTLDVRGDCLIGWPAKNSSYKKLTDYISALDVENDNDVCDYAVGLAKANGMSLSKLFIRYEG